MRAGRPWNATRSPAMRIHLAKPSSSGNSSSTARSVAAMSAGSPDSATPAERALALAEQRTDVGREEAGVVERPVEATQLGLGPKTVAVVEHLGAGVHEPDHRRTVRSHRFARATNQLSRIICAQTIDGLGRHVMGNVRKRIVGARLIQSRCRPESPRPAVGAPYRRRYRRHRPTMDGARAWPSHSGRRHRRVSRQSRRGSGFPPDAAPATDRCRCRAPPRRSW